jgi:ADP-heptose:LPS heptosyltransferase
LQEKTFEVSQKGVFENYIKNYNLVSPEPYHVYGYYNQEKSLAEAFDEIINKTDDHSDLDKPNLYVSYEETAKIKSNIDAFKQQVNKDKIIVFQPFGSGARIENNMFIDSSGRSMYPEDFALLCKHLSNYAAIVYFGPPDLFMLSGSTDSLCPPTPDLRMYMALINQCDYFIGCDSVGQHMARAFDKKGLVLMGSTFEKNVSYPDYYKFYRNEHVRVKYNPIRIGGLDCQLADRTNDGAMKFDEGQLKEIFNIIGEDLKGSYGKQQVIKTKSTKPRDKKGF